MTSGTARRTTLLDLILGVAATAVSLAMAQAVALPPVRGPYPFFFGAIQGPVSAVAALWGLLLILLRLLPPRPRWRRLLRQPGFVASLGLAFGMGLGVLNWAILLLRLPLLGDPMAMTILDDPINLFWAGTRPAMGVSVAASWLALALSGRWRAEAGWIDRLGRSFGGFWIIMLLFEDPTRLWVALALPYLL